MNLGFPELMIVLVIVLLLFGVGRIGKIAGELGTGIRAFRNGLQDDKNDKKTETKSEVSTEEKSKEK